MSTLHPVHSEAHHDAECASRFVGIVGFEFELEVLRQLSNLSFAVLASLGQNIVGQFDLLARVHYPAPLIACRGGLWGFHCFSIFADLNACWDCKS